VICLTPELGVRVQLSQRRNPDVDIRFRALPRLSGLLRCTLA
jgi:hypothetical protein